GLTGDVDIGSGVAAKLTEGTKYYFVVKLSSKTIQENDAQDDGTDPNNVAASDTAYDYVGSPKTQANVFPTRYFRIIRNALQGVDPFQAVGAPAPTDGPHFTAAFESPGGYDHPNLGAHLDSKGIPTIGIGLNLNTLSSTIRSELADDVRDFYHNQAANHVPGYTNIDNLRDNQVINMLRSQAQAAGPGNQGQDALTTADAQALFNEVYTNHENAVIADIGQATWNSLGNNIHLVLPDVHFNIGTSFTRLLSDLQEPTIDYSRVGFHFLDNKRTVDVGDNRSLAGYEFLVQGHLSEIGQLV